MIGARRFELPASCSRSRRATRLRYAPIHVPQKNSYIPKTVGARGFEPPTPCTPCKCATRLRHAPIIWDVFFAIRSSSRECFSSTTQVLLQGRRVPTCQRQGCQNHPCLGDLTSRCPLLEEFQKIPFESPGRNCLDRLTIASPQKSYSNPCKGGS